MTPPRPTSQGPRETALYIEEMAASMREMAKKDKLEFLAYLLGMVKDEASVLAGTPKKEQG